MGNINSKIYTLDSLIFNHFPTFSVFTNSKLTKLTSQIRFYSKVARHSLISTPFFNEVLDEDFGFDFVTQTPMGVVKSWLLSMNHTHSNTKHVFCSRSIPWSLICGFMLFGLGLISLLTGHVVSHVEWYSQRFVHRSFFSSSVSLLFPFMHCIT